MSLLENNNESNSGDDKPVSTNLSDFNSISTSKCDLDNQANFLDFNPDTVSVNDNINPISYSENNNLLDLNFFSEVSVSQTVDSKPNPITDLSFNSDVLLDIFNQTNTTEVLGQIDSVDLLSESKEDSAKVEKLEDSFLNQLNDSTSTQPLVSTNSLNFLEGAANNIATDSSDDIFGLFESKNSVADPISDSDNNLVPPLQVDDIFSNLISIDNSESLKESNPVSTKNENDFLLSESSKIPQISLIEDSQTPNTFVEDIFHLDQESVAVTSMMENKLDEDKDLEGENIFYLKRRN